MSQNRLQGKKVIVVPLVLNKRCFTKGQTVTEEIDVGAVAKMGPAIQKLRVQFDGADYAGNFQVRFLFRYTVTGRVYSQDVPIRRTRRPQTRSSVPGTRTTRRSAWR